VARVNASVARGEDDEFGRGTTAYSRYLGDPAAPSPYFGPIGSGPFYGVRLVMGDLGTFAGLMTDARARVLDRDGKPVPGLYAAGNDAHSIMGGNYLSGGITLGPAVVFGYVAGRDLATTQKSARRFTMARHYRPRAHSREDQWNDKTHDDPCCCLYDRRTLVARSRADL
jgi:hypothetical protein